MPGRSHAHHFKTKRRNRDFLQTANQNIKSTSIQEYQVVVTTSELSGEGVMTGQRSHWHNKTIKGM